jgi:hypothetical protein
MHLHDPLKGGFITVYGSLLCEGQRRIESMAQFFGVFFLFLRGGLKVNFLENVSATMP